MTYKETEKKLDQLRAPDEIMFRMAISHLMDVGISNLTPEVIEECCAEIDTEDDSHSFMTNNYKKAIVRLAGEIAKLDHIHLIVYLQTNVEYDVYSDGIHIIPYRRMKEIASNALELMKENEDVLWDGFEYVAQFQIGMDENELESFGYHVEEEEMDDVD